MNKKKLNKTNTLNIGIIILILMGFCLWFFEGRHIHTKVGDFKIYKKDIAYRNQIIKLQYPEEKQDFGLLQLEKSYINYQIMKNNKFTAIDERLKSESERIDAKTKNPEMLKKIKDLFGKDTKAYQRVFVAPSAIDEMIYYSFFPQQGDYQAQTQKKSEALLEEIKTSKASLKETAEKEKLDFRMIQITKSGIVPVDAKTLKPFNDRMRDDRHQKNNKEEDPMAKQWIDIALKDRKDGDMVTDVIGLEDRYLIAKLYKKTKDTYLVEIIDVPKKTFFDYVEVEKQKIPVKAGFFLF